jgi:ABC-2 type transport system ATP-binding protein
VNVIETDSLTKYYGKTRGIADVNITVKQGDFTGFVGPNGSGKSTTIRTLLGLISPSSGSAKVLGRDVRTDSTDILSRIGYLPSENAFYSGARVRDILEYSARLRKKDCSREAAALCTRLQLDPSRRISELSLGNRKKVGIVCALQHSPELYILDEPTSGLDPLMQQEFYALLRERNEQGASVFLSSHVLSEVSRYCSRAVIIREGRVVASDTVEALGGSDVKRVTLKGADSLPQLEGIGAIARDGQSVSFLYRGDIRLLIQALAGVSFEDVTVVDPPLDEVFMHYYAEEGAR